MWGVISMVLDWQALSDPAIATAISQAAEGSGAPISPIRIAGIVVGAIFLGFILRQTAKGSTPRLHSLIAMLFGLALVLVSSYPGIVTLVFGPFSLAEGEGFPRITGLLIVAVGCLSLYQFLLTSSVVSGRREFTALVRALALERYVAEAGSYPTAKVLVVVPAYNEEGSLASVLSEMPTEVYGLSVHSLVIVDGATDGTEAVARQFGIPVVHSVNCGQPISLITGYEVAKRCGASIVAVIDADGQMVPGELERIVAPVADGAADLAIGSRVLGAYHVDNRARGLGVRLFGLLVSALIRQRITDASNGMRALRVDSLKRLRLQDERLGGAAELWVEAYRRGLKIQEVPVTIRPRTAGESRKPASLRYGFVFGWALIRSWLK